MSRGNTSHARILSIITVVLLSMFLAACGGGGDSGGTGDDQGGDTTTSVSNGGDETTTTVAGDDGEVVEIEYWTMPFAGLTAEGIQGYVDDFNETNPGIHVNLQVLEWSDGREKIKQAVAAGTGPDVFLMAPMDQDYLSSGSLASLDALGFGDEDIEPFLDLIQSTEHEGALYGVPTGWYANMLYVNYSILAEYGYETAPETWDELHDMALDISTSSAEAGSPVVGFQVKGMGDHLNAINHTWPTFLFAAGGQFLSDDLSTSTQSSPEGIEAMAYLRSFFDEGIAEVGLSANGGFIDGQVAMYSFTQAEFGTIDASNLEDDWSVALMPEGPNGRASYIGGEFLVGNADSSNLESAGDFIKWMASPEQTIEYMDTGVSLMPYKVDALESEAAAAVEALLDADPRWSVLLEQLTYARPSDVLMERLAAAARWEAQRQNVVAALSGQTDVESALEEIDSQVDQALGG